MNLSKFVVAYSFCLCLMSVGIFGIFYQNFWCIEDSAMLFYIQMSFAFVCVISLLLCGYYSGILARHNTNEYLKHCTEMVVKMDVNKISFDDMDYTTRKLIFSLNKVEKSKFSLYAYAIPFFVLFSSVCILIFYINKELLLSLFIMAVLEFIIVDMLIKIISKCSLNQHEIFLEKFIDITLCAARGVQYYDAADLVLGKFDEDKKLIKDMSTTAFSRCVFKAVARLCGVFCGVCVLYILKEDYVSNRLFDITSGGCIYYTALFFWLISIMAYVKYLDARSIKLEDIAPKDCMILNEEKENEKKLTDENLFLAFHGICFQDPANLSEEPTINNVSFSILPGEVVAIIGENVKAASYIYDLILKYYKPQSGNVYIGGSNINGINTKSLRALVGVFKQDFGLINGTVLDNLKIVPLEERRLLVVAEKLGLNDVLDLEIFDDNADVQLSQETLLRIQIARIFLQKPKMVLVESPEYFDSEDAKILFANFLDHISKRKTVIISTARPSIFIYADKILYLGCDKSLFGTHADLSLDTDYQNYVSA